MGRIRLPRRRGPAAMGKVGPVSASVPAINPRIWRHADPEQDRRHDRNSKRSVIGNNRTIPTYSTRPRSRERRCGIDVRCRQRLHRTVGVVRSECYAVSCGCRVLGWPRPWPETSERITSWREHWYWLHASLRSFCWEGLSWQVSQFRPGLPLRNAREKTLCESSVRALARQNPAGSWWNCQRKYLMTL